MAENANPPEEPFIDIRAFRRGERRGHRDRNNLPPRQIITYEQVQALNYRQLMQLPDVLEHQNDLREQLVNFLADKFPSFYEWSANHVTDIAEFHNIWWYREYLIGRNQNISEEYKRIKELENPENEIERLIKRTNNWNERLPSGVMNVNLAYEEGQMDAILIEPDNLNINDRFYTFNFTREGGSVNFAKLTQLGSFVFDKYYTSTSDSQLLEKLTIYVLHPTYLESLNSLKVNPLAIICVFLPLFTSYSIFENKLIDCLFIDVLIYLAEKIREYIVRHYKDELESNPNYDANITSQILNSGHEGKNLNEFNDYINRQNNESFLSCYTLFSLMNSLNRHIREVSDYLKDICLPNDLGWEDPVKMCSRIANMFNFKYDTNVHVNPKYFTFKVSILASCRAFYRSVGKWPSKNASAGSSTSIGIYNLTDKKINTERALANQACSIDVSKMNFRSVIEDSFDMFSFKQIIQMLSGATGKRNLEFLNFVYIIFPDSLFHIDSLNIRDQLFIRSIILLRANGCLLYDKNLNRKVDDKESDGFVKNMINEIFYLLTRGHIEFAEDIMRAIMQINPRTNYDNMMQYKKLIQNYEDGHKYFSFYNVNYLSEDDSIFNSDEHMIRTLRRLCEHSFLSGKYFCPLKEGVKGYSSIIPNAINQQNRDVGNDDYLGWTGFYRALGAPNEFWKDNYSPNDISDMRINEQREIYERKIQMSKIRHEWEPIEVDDDGDCVQYQQLEEWMDENYAMTREIAIANHNVNYGKYEDNEVQTMYSAQDCLQMFPQILRIRQEDNALVSLPFANLNNNNRNTTATENIRGNAKRRLIENLRRNNNLFVFNRQTARQRYQDLYGENDENNNDNNGDQGREGGHGANHQNNNHNNDGEREQERRQREEQERQERERERQRQEEQRRAEQERLRREAEEEAERLRQNDLNFKIRNTAVMINTLIAPRHQNCIINNHIIDNLNEDIRTNLSYIGHYWVSMQAWGDDKQTIFEAIGLNNNINLETAKDIMAGYLLESTMRLQKAMNALNDNEVDLTEERIYEGINVNDPDQRNAALVYLNEIQQYL